MSDDLQYFTLLHQVQKLVVTEVSVDLTAMIRGGLSAELALQRNTAIALAARAGGVNLNAALKVLPQAESFTVNGGDPSRSILSTFSIKLNKSAGETLTRNDLQIYQKNDGKLVVLNMNAVDFRYDEHTFTGTWTLAAEAYSGGKLADGEYRIVLDGAALHDLAGTQFDLAGNGIIGSEFSYDFNVLNGDTDGNGRLSPSDLGLLRGLIKSNKYERDYDSNNDGKLDLADVAYFRSIYLGQAVVQPVVIASTSKSLFPALEQQPAPAVSSQPAKATVATPIAGPGAAWVSSVQSDFGSLREMGLEQGGFGTGIFMRFLRFEGESLSTTHDDFWTLIRKDHNHRGEQ
jgi:hypothetical protein